MLQTNGNKKINVDSVIKRNSVPTKVTKTRTNKPSLPNTLHTKKFPYKTLSLVLGTFLITFIFAIATSSIMAANRNSDQPTQIATTNELRTDTENVPTENQLSVVSTPDNSTLADEVVETPGQVYLPKENITAPDPLEKRKEFLEQYLTARNSVLADHVDALSEQSQWKLIIAISRAESSFCKHHQTNNCWGIGGAWNMKKYANYDEAIADVNRILEQHYIAAGLNSPKKIVNKWVGHPNENWESAVQQELDNLKDVE